MTRVHIRGGVRVFFSAVSAHEPFSEAARRAAARPCCVPSPPGCSRAASRQQPFARPAATSGAGAGGSQKKGDSCKNTQENRNGFHPWREKHRREKKNALCGDRKVRRDGPTSQ